MQQTYIIKWKILEQCTTLTVNLSRSQVIVNRLVCSIHCQEHKHTHILYISRSYKLLPHFTARSWPNTNLLLPFRLCGRSPILIIPLKVEIVLHPPDTYSHRSIRLTTHSRTEFPQEYTCLVVQKEAHQSNDFKVTCEERSNSHHPHIRPSKTCQNSLLEWAL